MFFSIVWLNISLVAIIVLSICITLFSWPLWYSIIITNLITFTITLSIFLIGKNQILSIFAIYFNLRNFNKRIKFKK